MPQHNPFAGSGPDDPPAPLGGGSGPSGTSGGDGHSGGPGETSGAGNGGDVSRIRARIDPERDLACCRLPLTDLGNAERWRFRFGSDFRFCPELGWFAWDGRRWDLLSEEKDSVPAELMDSIALVVRAIRNEASLVAASGYDMPPGLSDKEIATIEAWADREGAASRELYLRGDDDGTRAKWLESLDVMDAVMGKSLWSHKVAAWAKSSETGAMPGRMLKWIKGFRGVVVRPDVFDTDPLAINVLNGTLRLRQVRRKRSAEDIAAGKSQWRAVWDVDLDKHNRDDLITKLAPVKFHRGAKCPAYDAFIQRVQPNPEMRRFLHQWGGYSLTGDTTEHKFAFFYGEGRNGKGTWVEALAHLAGDYAGSIQIESLLNTGGQRRGDQATPDTAELPGVRFLRVSEPQKGMAFNDGLVKQLSGGDPVKARHLNKGFFEFFPDFKLCISGNVKPNIKDLSHGMWSRLQLVPWGQIIPEDEIDRSLPDTLKSEASGILNRMVEGMIDWKRNGLLIPFEVRQATADYREASDEIGRFLADLCELGPDLRMPAGEMYEFYKAWGDVAGGSGWRVKGFSDAMGDKGFRKIRSDGVKWVGVRVRPGNTLEEVRRGEWWTPAEPPQFRGDYDE